MANEHKKLENQALADDIAKYHFQTGEMQAALALKYNKDIRFMKTRIEQDSRFKDSRAPNMWNAYLHYKSLDLTECMDSIMKSCYILTAPINR